MCGSQEGDGPSAARLGMACWRRAGCRGVSVYEPAEKEIGSRREGDVQHRWGRNGVVPGHE